MAKRTQRTQPSGAANRKRARARRAAERVAETQRRAEAAARGEPAPAHRYTSLLARRPSGALGLSAWMAEVLGESVVELLEDQTLTADDRRRWLRDLGRTFSSVAPRGASESTLRRLERVAGLAPEALDSQLDRDPASSPGPQPRGASALDRDPEATR